MALHYSKYFKIPHSRFVELGVYDAKLDGDYQLHVDPILLKNCNIPEFKTAYNDFLEYFKPIVTLVDAYNRGYAQERCFKQIVKRFTFKELSNTGLGYSELNRKGNGIGGKISENLAHSAIEIISLGFKDPELFAILPLLEEQIGADRISDMTLYILHRHFYKYSERICKELGIKTKTVKLNGENHDLAIYRKWPIMFIPTKFLCDLPKAHSKEDVSRVCSYNDHFRRLISSMIGMEWEKASRLRKSEIKEYVFSQPKLYKAAIDKIKGISAVPYDFKTDKNEVYGNLAIQELIDNNPISFINIRYSIESIEYVQEVVNQICTQFKSLIEDNRLSQILYRKNRQPDEKDWQLLLYSVAKTYIEASQLKIDLTRENDVGTGEIDFKFSHGANKVIVEMKRSGNKDIIHGYRSQLPKYMKAENTSSGMFIILMEDDKQYELESKLQSIQDQMRSEGEIIPPIMFIDGQRKQSASKK